MPLRPYLKNFIAGGIVLAEGGGFLPIGLMLFTIWHLISSGVGNSDFSKEQLYSMAFFFTIVGAASLVIGIILFATGAQERKRYLAYKLKRKYSGDTHDPTRIESDEASHGHTSWLNS